MNAELQSNVDQATLWNGAAGQAWVQTQDLLDDVLKPFVKLLLDSAWNSRRVLDVGCGAGATTLAAAGMLGADGRAVGVDISGPLIAAARARAEREGAPASFIQADAQTYRFAPASFDRIVSRFGVMFFDDFVAAFANLRRAAKDDAELRFLCWRSPEENPFMTTAERAAAPLLPQLPTRRPGAPGQFALAAAGRTRQILEESGWTKIRVQPVDVPCAFAEAELVRYFTTMGPIGLALREADSQTRAQVIDAVRGAFEPYVNGADVRFTAACWLVVARF